MATEFQVHQEKGIGSNSQIRSPTDSNSLCPPKPRFVLVICENCGEMFQRILSQYNLYKTHFCSRECYNLYGRINVNCYRCGVSFIVKKSKWKNSKTKIFFCCLSCRRDPPVNCDWCGTEFIKYRNKQNKNKFCSVECKAHWQSENIRAENHHRWTGGEHKYYGRGWEKQRIRVIERDKHTCQKCGKTEDELNRNLDVHHIIPFRIFGLKNYEKANRLSNLISLCNPCHRVIEKEVNI